jgi:small-conductance mechanosensitive channel
MDSVDLQVALTTLLDATRHTLRTELTSIWLPVQIGLIALAAVVAGAVSVTVRKRIDFDAFKMDWPPLLRTIARVVLVHLGTLTFIVVLLIARSGLRMGVEHPRTYLLRVAISLITAWLVINVLASFIHNRFVNRVVAVSAWTIAALSILRLLDPVAASLDSSTVSIAVGGLRITPLIVLKTTALLLITLWAANAISNFVDRRIQTFADLTPSIQVLIGKLIRIALITFAIVLVLSSMGIDLSVLALFSGAVGVGLGFGLQKIVSNLVSGIILLADKSIKPGDVISVGESFGWVGSMGARCTSIVTRDGREYLIPNEDFVTQRVINWSYSNDEVRLEVSFGVSYASDPHKVCAFAVEATKSAPRALASPGPTCHLKGFGDSSLNFVLRFWIKDPVEGITNVRSEVLLALWDIFKREGIEIPFPQRDVNMRMPVQVEIKERN